MSKALALMLVCGVCLCLSATTSGAAPLGDVARSCAAGGCGVDDEVALMQHTVKSHRRGAFPDLGKLADQATDMAGKAKAAVSDVAAGAIATVGKTIDTTLSTLSDTVDKYSVELNASGASIEIGVASLLAKRFNASVPDLPSGGNLEKYEEDAQAKINSAVTLFDSLVKSVDSASGAVTKVPFGSDDLTESLNATLQTALAKCTSLLGSLKDVQGLMETPTAAKQSLMQTREDPGETITKLKQAMKSALDQTTGFSDSFTGAFQKLSDSVVEASKGKLSPDALSKVTATFDGLTATSQKIGKHGKDAVTQLLGSLSKGVAATGIEGSNAAGAKLGVLVMLLTTLAGML